MRAVKFFVILGAVVLMVGLGALVSRISGNAPAAAQSGLEAVPLVEENLAIPHGARVVQLVGMDSSGVATLVELPDGGAQLLLFSAHGKLKRRISLTPAARSPGN